MTEEDTFNKLKRITYDEMYEIYREWPLNMSLLDRCKTLKIYYWDPIEFYTLLYSHLPFDSLYRKQCIEKIKKICNKLK